MGLVQRVPVYTVHCNIAICSWDYFKTKFHCTSGLPIPKLFNDFDISKIKMKKLVSSSMLDVFKWYR